MMATTVVLCLGNPLMTDDGLGLAVLDRLRHDWTLDDVELVDGATWGLSLLPVIEDSRRLLVVDAITAGQEPGSLVTLERERLPIYLSRKLSPHQVDLKDALALAAWRGHLPDDIVAIGSEPETVELGTELSPRVAASVETVADTVVARLEAWGHHCVPTGAAPPAHGATFAGHPHWAPDA
jgi:hydrogenase maturation protease